MNWNIILIQLLSVFRCKCSRVSADTLWGSGDDSGSSPWGAAPPPTARGQQQQHWLVHAARLCSKLETERWSVLALSHASHTVPKELVHTLPQCSPHTGRGGQFPAMAAAAVCVTGDSAQGGPIRQRGGRARRKCCFRALACPIRSSTGER